MLLIKIAHQDPCKTLRKGRSSLVLRAKTVAEKRSWLKCLNEARDSTEEAGLVEVARCMERPQNLAVEKAAVPTAESGARGSVDRAGTTPSRPAIVPYKFPTVRPWPLVSGEQSL